MAKFVHNGLGSERYGSPFEARDEAEKLRWLQHAWKEGIESGDYRPLDIEAIKAAGRKVEREKKLTLLMRPSHRE
jgi:hypothetical protein